MTDKATKLWAVFDRQTCEFHAAPSEEKAHQAAKRHNGLLKTEAANKVLQSIGATPDIFEVDVVEWPFDADEHADDVDDFYEYWGIDRDE